MTRWIVLAVALLTSQNIAQAGKRWAEEQPYELRALMCQRFLQTPPVRAQGAYRDASANTRAPNMSRFIGFARVIASQEAKVQAALIPLHLLRVNDTYSFTADEGDVLTSSRELGVAALTLAKMHPALNYAWFQYRSARLSNQLEGFSEEDQQLIPAIVREFNSLVRTILGFRVQAKRKSDSFEIAYLKKLQEPLIDKFIDYSSADDFMPLGELTVVSDRELIPVPQAVDDPPFVLDFHTGAVMAFSLQLDRNSGSLLAYLIDYAERTIYWKEYRPEHQVIQTKKHNLKSMSAAELVSEELYTDENRFPRVSLTEFNSTLGQVVPSALYGSVARSGGAFWRYPDGRFYLGWSAGKRPVRGNSDR